MQYAAVHLVMKPIARSLVQRSAARRHRHEVVATLVGALGGAGMGAIAAGPPWALVGALLGAVTGMGTAWSAEANSIQREQEGETGASEGDSRGPGQRRTGSTTHLE
jgi:hypothetical protein